MSTDQAHQMLLAAQNVISVHLSGANVTLVAVILTGVVGVTAPLLTGLFLWASTKRITGAQRALAFASVEAERLRLEMTLQAERDRLRDQLAFEREDRERREVREILDHLGRELASIDEGVQSSVNSAWLLEPPNRQSLTSQLGRAVAAAREETRRLRLRLGPDRGEILEIAEHITDVGISAMLSLELLNPRPWARNQSATDSLSKARAELLGFRDRFMTAAHRISEASLSPGPPPG